MKLAGMSPGSRYGVETIFGSYKSLTFLFAWELTTRREGIGRPPPKKLLYVFQRPINCQWIEFLAEEIQHVTPCRESS